MDYLERQMTLKKKADEILTELHLVDFLKNKWEVHFVGSYMLDLMSWEDIDIVVNGEQNIDDFLDAVGFLFKYPSVYSLNIQDFRKSIYPNRPFGLYCGVTYLIRPKTFWKIDIWFMAQEDKKSEEFAMAILSRLNEEKRNLILNIKNEMRSTEWGKGISGMEVYTAVLDFNITNTKWFQEYFTAR